VFVPHSTVGTLLLCIHELATPFRRGFNCDDETIRYPYKESTISSAVCYSVGSGINVILILILEYVNLRKRPQSNEGQSSNGYSSEIDQQFSTLLYAKNVYCRLLVWFFGGIASELLTDISKISAGRLRPHFIQVCRPSVNGQPLDEYCNNSKPFEYITNYTCEGFPEKQRDIRMSFLSGHSSYSAYSATFAILYLQESLDANSFGFLKPAVQVLIGSAAFYTGLSRISDYKHHWQDVLAGLLLGTTMASIITIHVWPSVQKTYTKYWNKYTTNKLTDSNEATSAELNQLSY